MSGRKNFLRPKKIISAGDASQATVTSSVVNIEGLDNIAVQLNITSGSPTGVLAVQVSGDYDQDASGNVISAGNWVSLPVTISVASGSPANSFLNCNQMSSLWVRALYTKTSGTGAFDVYVSGKQL